MTIHHSTHTRYVNNYLAFRINEIENSFAGKRGNRLSSALIMSAVIETPSDAVSDYEVGNCKPPPWAQFKPGQSGNPGGFPKGTPKISTAYAYLMAMSPAELEAFEPKNVAEQIALERVREAGKKKGLRSTVEITDRIEGKARQSVDVTATTVNVNVQVNLFLDAAADLASRHNVPLELAQARMLAIAEPAQRVAIEAALTAMNTTDK